MLKLEVTDQELEVLHGSVVKYQEYLTQKIKELNECSSHFFVNEGLMNEVRIEKEKYQKELIVIEELLKKCGEVPHE